MPFRLSLKKLIRRNSTAGLRERADELRGSLAGQTRRAIVAGTAAAAVPLPALATPDAAPVERAEYRARLLAAYEEDRLSRPISGKCKGGSIEERAACIVQMRCWALAREILALPPPATADGLALTALAATVLVEADFTNNDPTVTAAVGMTRAALGFTGTPHLFGFVGFGDEPDLRAKEDAVYAETGSLPAWAIALAKAERARGNDEDETDA